MKKVLSLILLLGAIMALTSCGTARTMVTEPVIIPRQVASVGIQVTQGQHTVPVPMWAVDSFEKSLKKMLYVKKKLRYGNGVTLSYRFVQFNEGSRLARHFLGGLGNTGEASMMVEVSYFDTFGNFLGKTLTDGRITSGFYGGSSEEAVDAAANEVANYTETLMHCN